MTSKRRHDEAAAHHAKAVERSGGAPKVGASAEAEPKPLRLTAIHAADAASLEAAARGAGVRGAGIGEDGRGFAGEGAVRLNEIAAGGVKSEMKTSERSRTTGAFSVEWRRAA